MLAQIIEVGGKFEYLSSLFIAGDFMLPDYGGLRCPITQNFWTSFRLYTEGQKQHPSASSTGKTHSIWFIHVEFPLSRSPL